MRLRIKKANDTLLKNRSPQHNAALLKAIEATLDNPKFENFDFVQSSDSKDKFSIYNYEKDKYEDLQYLDQDAKDFIEALDKELKKQELFIFGEDRPTPKFFVILTKKEKEEFTNRKERIRREREDREAFERERKETFNQRVQEMVDFINERVGDFIIWNDPPYRTNNNDEIRPSFRYNRDADNFDAEQVKQASADYLEQQN